MAPYDGKAKKMVVPLQNFRFRISMNIDESLMSRQSLHDVIAKNGRRAAMQKLNILRTI